MSEVVAVSPGNFTEAFGREAVRLDIAAWPKEQRDEDAEVAHLCRIYRDYRGPKREEPRWFALRIDGRLVAEAGTERRAVRFADGPKVIMALTSVCVDLPFRGRGYGMDVVRAAFERVDTGEFPFALWQTSVALRPFYERLGATTVTNRFVNSWAHDPETSPWWDEVVMAYALTKEGWPSGTIDLEGPGF